MTYSIMKKLKQRFCCAFVYHYFMLTCCAAYSFHSPVTLLLVGLDNAGKTTAAKGIVGGESGRAVSK